MKKLISFIVILSMLLTGCTCQNKIQSGKDAVNTSQSKTKMETEETITEEKLDDEADDTPYEYQVKYDKLDDADLMRYMQDSVYYELVQKLDSNKYYVDNISAQYVSQEYIDELTYNSQSNIFFGYTLEELNSQFSGERYVFTLDDNKRTTVKPFEEYEDIYSSILKNVAVGTGVILLCVTISCVAGGAGSSAICAIFATAAKDGTIIALSTGSLGAVTSGIVTGIQTGDMKQALKAAEITGAEDFMWGAVCGAVSGASSAAGMLKRATLNGLTMNEAATIQKESKYPIEVISEFHNMQEYQVFKDAKLTSKMINGKLALIRTDIDLNITDEFGRTNLQRMKKGLSPLDANHDSYELHHIGQSNDGTLAVLSMKEHDNPILHGYRTDTEIDRSEFSKIRKEFWKTMANIFESGEL